MAGIVLLTMCGAVLAGCGDNSAPAAGTPGVAVNGSAGGGLGSVGQAGGGQANAKPLSPSGQSAQGDRAAQNGEPIPQLPVPGRQVVRTATIGLRVTNLRTAESAVRQIAAGAGGYAGEEDDQSGQASFTLQVPQAALDVVLDQLSHQGTQTSRTEHAQDVTDQMVDVRSRLATQTASVDRVRALMDKATSIGDVVNIEGELTKREADLESLEQQQAELTNQVAMSTVSVQLTQAATPVAAAAVTPSGFVGGLASGWHAFLGALGVLLVVLGAVLPFLVVSAGLGLLAWWLVRRRRAAAVTVAPAGKD
jgi:hypothetical protein